MKFSITYDISSVLRNLMLFMLWVNLSNALMPMVGISSTPDMTVQVLALPHRQCETPSRLLELETLSVL
jgi:hypothetical protein